MAQNEPQLKETPSGPSPNSPSFYLNISVEAANLSDWRNESNRIETFFPNWNALPDSIAIVRRPRH